TPPGMTWRALSKSARERSCLLIVVLSVVELVLGRLVVELVLVVRRLVLVELVVVLGQRRDLGHGLVRTVLAALLGGALLLGLDHALHRRHALGRVQAHDAH